MPFNQNSNFMQQMTQNNQRFQQFAQQNMQRQQNQFKTTANGWARDAQRRSQQQQQNQVQYQRAAHLQQKARSRQPQPSSAASFSSRRSAAQPQPPWGRGPSCRRCGSTPRPGLQTCPGCGASSTRALARTLWAATFIILVLCFITLAIVLGYTHPPGHPRPIARPQLPAHPRATRHSCVREQQHSYVPASRNSIDQLPRRDSHDHNL
jgi:exonuclease VII large subunit